MYLLEDGDLSLTLKHLKSNTRTVIRWVSTQEEWVIKSDDECLQFS